MIWSHFELRPRSQPRNRSSEPSILDGGAVADSGPGRKIRDAPPESVVVDDWKEKITWQSLENAAQLGTSVEFGKLEVQR